MVTTKTCTYWILFQLWLHSATTLPNVALSGTASESTTAYDGMAWKAIDGNRDPLYENGHCTHTQDNDYYPWWRVLLTGIFKVTAVSITNRSTYSERLDNAEILIGNSAENNGNNNPRCAVISTVPAGETVTFQCGGMEGRFVNVYRPGQSKTITLCEVEVYAVPAVPLLSGSLLGRNIMIVGKRLCWSDALFFCRYYFWDLLSIHSQEEQMELEKVLNNSPFALTKLMWLGLRRFLMSGEWFWMSGDSMNYTQLDIASTWQLSSPCGAMDTSSPFQWTDHSCDEHLYFVCLTDLQEDVNRVEFFSTRREVPVKTY